jgi:hypothetical protein
MDRKDKCVLGQDRVVGKGEAQNADGRTGITSF